MLSSREQAGVLISAAMQQSQLGGAGCREALPGPLTSQMPQEPWEQPRVMSAPASLATFRTQRHRDVCWPAGKREDSSPGERQRRQKAYACCRE
jgi:hypothetical protein